MNSLFDLASGLCRPADVVGLRDHHRSHADIIEFSNQQFYDGRLRIATRYEKLRRPTPDGPAVRWVHVKGKVVRPASGGGLNQEEAAAVVRELERLVVEQRYLGSVGVVSPFRAQANRIRELVSQNALLSERLLDHDFIADTAHRFQGDERDVVIFSPVVSQGVTDSALLFLRKTPNLFNVAITRARAALVVIGDRDAALTSGVDYLAAFAEYAQRSGRQLELAPEERPVFGVTYPQVSRPELVSEWEKVLYVALFRAGIRPLPQYEEDKYVLDFAVLDGDRRLDVEVDGERYHRNWDGELCRTDQIRNLRLMELGWDVMRFWVYQVRDELDECVAKVLAWQTGG